MNTILLVSFALLILVISLGESDAHRSSRWRPTWLSRACPRNYCRNDGVCRRKRGSISCKCQCGFTGSRCECKRDECATNNPCQFNSLCLNNVGGPGVTCQCPTGYSGENCEININDCTAESCQNGGTCVDGINSFSCNCPANFQGKFCEVGPKVDQCVTANPCQFNSLCLNNVDGPGVTCTCPTGYSGLHCEINIDDCVNTPCKNNGTCVDGINSFVCDCPANIRGRFCELDCNTIRQIENLAVQVPSIALPLPKNGCNDTACVECRAVQYFERGTECTGYFAPVLSVFLLIDSSLNEITSICKAKCLSNDQCKFATATADISRYVCLQFENDDIPKQFGNDLSVGLKKNEGCLETP